MLGVKGPTGPEVGLQLRTGEGLAKSLSHGVLERLVLQKVQVDRLGGPSAMLLDVLKRDSSLERSSPPPLSEAATCVALWNMALRVEAEMVFPIGGAVVSKSCVVLSGGTQGSMCWYRFPVATGQMRLSSRVARGMVVTPRWVWRVLVHLRSRRRPCLQGLMSAQEECLAGSKDWAVGGARFEILR